MFRWWVLCLGLWSLCSHAVWAAPRRITIQSYRANHPELQWLRRFLRMRGYELVKTPNSREQLVLHIQSSRLVSLRRGNVLTRYRIPRKMDSAVVRARMFLVCVDLFLDTLRNDPMPSRSPTAPIDIFVPHKDGLLSKQHRAPKTQRRNNARKPLRKIKKQLSNRPSFRKDGHRRRPPRKVHVHTKPSKPRLLALRSVPISNKLQPHLHPPKRRPLPHQSFEKKHLADAMAFLGSDALPTPKLQATREKQDSSPRLWGKILSLDLAISGEFRWASADHWFWGGRLGVGLNIKRFSLHAELSIHSYALQTREAPLPAYIPLFTPSFYVGYRLPLGSIERWLSLSVRFGTETEAFVLESTYIANPEKAEGATKSHTIVTTPLYWGIMLGLQLHWQFAGAWSVFVRPTFVFYPGGVFRTQKTDLIEKTSLSPYQVSTLVGIQVRL